MTKNSGIKRTPGIGVDRIEWKDAKHRVHSARATDPASVEKVAPAQPARLPMKWDTQRSSQGYYWCACTETMVRYESMSEFTAMFTSRSPLGCQVAPPLVDFQMPPATPAVHISSFFVR